MIAGKHTDYLVASAFDTDFRYSKFDLDHVAPAPTKTLLLPVAAEVDDSRYFDAAPVAAGWQLLTRDNGPDGFYLACLHKRKAADDNKVTDQRS